MSAFASASVRFVAKMPTTWPCRNSIGGAVCSKVTGKPAFLASVAKLDRSASESAPSISTSKSPQPSFSILIPANPSAAAFAFSSFAAASVEKWPKTASLC